MCGKAKATLPAWEVLLPLAPCTPNARFKSHPVGTTELAHPEWTASGAGFCLVLHMLNDGVACIQLRTSTAPRKTQSKGQSTGESIVINGRKVNRLNVSASCTD